MKIYTVFVEPKTSGNIGFLARSMKNFGLKKLVLINPCKLENDAYYQAMHAREIVQDALVYDSIDEFIEDKKIISVIGTTGSAGGVHNIKRTPITPNQLGKTINMDNNTAILFGREGDGLYNHEIELCDVLVSIPANNEYPIMNITHAASIIFYELFINKEDTVELEPENTANYDDKKALTELTNEIISKIDYPEHKENQVKTITRNILGRAFMTGREVHTLRGTLKRINQRINKYEE